MTTALSASSVTTSPFAPPVRNHGPFDGQVKQKCGGPVGCFIPLRGHNKLDRSSPICLTFQSQPFDRRRPVTYSSRKLSASVTFAVAAAARASASGQTQTLTREAPTITKAPMREPAKMPKLDDQGPGLPPHGHGGWGGGGGGGGGNWSGGFYLFGFLGFLGFLKDLERGDSGDSKR